MALVEDAQHRRARRHKLRLLLPTDDAGRLKATARRIIGLVPKHDQEATVVGVSLSSVIPYEVVTSLPTDWPTSSRLTDQRGRRDIGGPLLHGCSTGLAKWDLPCSEHHRQGRHLSGEPRAEVASWTAWALAGSSDSKRRCYSRRVLLGRWLPRLDRHRKNDGDYHEPS